MRLTIGIFIGVVALSCGLNESTVGSDGTLDDGAELSSTSRTYVQLRADQRACASPMCGGFFVHDVNRATLTEQYVSGLDFSQSTLSDADQQRIIEAADGDVVLRGKLGPKEPVHHTRAFIVTDAWRGMPSHDLASGDAFFMVALANIQCFAAPCPTMQATKANSTSKTLLHELDLGAMGFVDQEWLSKRVSEDSAIAAGQIVRADGKTTLAVSNVFVKLPENVGPCPALPQTQCPSHRVQTFKRNADRCIVPDACVSPGVCNFLVPNCGDGYTAVSWKAAPNACSVVSCDPSWLTE